MSSFRRLKNFSIVFMALSYRAAHHLVPTYSCSHHLKPRPRLSRIALRLPLISTPGKTPTLLPPSHYFYPTYLIRQSLTRCVRSFGRFVSLARSTQPKAPPSASFPGFDGSAPSVMVIQHTLPICNSDLRRHFHQPNHRSRYSMSLLGYSTCRLSSPAETTRR